MEGKPLSNVLFSIGLATTDYQVVEFELVGGSIAPAELQTLEAPKLDTRRGVVISGRGPTWLAACLVHQYHHHPWVACYDPRLGGVVVMAHKPGFYSGKVVDVDLQKKS